MEANPSAIWYFNDWENDVPLKLCSLAAQGLWKRMLCICARAEPIGYLAIDGKPCSMEELALIVGHPVAEIEPLVTELEARKIFSRTAKKVIYSRRMIRDAKASETNRTNGRKGGTVTRDKRKGIFGSPGPSPERGSEPMRKPAPEPVSEPAVEPPSKPASKPAPSPLFSPLLQDSKKENPSPITESLSRAREAERLIGGRFLALRDQLWPGSKPLASLTIQSQAGEYLATGLGEEEIWVIIDRGARRHAENAQSVIDSLRFFRNSVQDAAAEKRNRQSLNGDHPPEKIEPPLFVQWRVWIANWLEKSWWHDSQRIEDCPRPILEDNRAALEAKPPPGLRVKAKAAPAAQATP